MRSIGGAGWQSLWPREARKGANSSFLIYAYCKKSKCLNLYCDCFVARIYCADPCSCQGYLNKPEYEDTVLKTRQQIESHNPLAFLPKVVQRTTDSPSNNWRMRI